MAYNASPNMNEDKNMESTSPPPPVGAGASGTAQSSSAPASPTAPQTGPAVQSQQQQTQSSASTGVQTKPASSGGFTNLQSYMNQNKNAGQQLTNRIGTSVNRDVGTSVNQTQRALTSTEQANQAAQKNLTSGQNYLQQMSGGSSYTPDNKEAPSYLNPYMTASSPANQQPQQPTPTPGTFDAMSFVNDPAKLAQYNALRTGSLQANDQAALSANLANTQQQQGFTQSLVSNLTNQLGSSANRGNLLSQYVNRNPQYSQSAQNLDAYFLQKDQPGISNLQNQVKNTQNTTLKGIADQISGLQSGANELSQKGQDLSSGLQNKANENVSTLMNQLGSQTDEVNAIRAAEQKYAQDQYARLQAGQSVDQRFADILGLKQGQRLFNTATNDLGSYINLSPAQATSAQDVANQQDVQQYQALARLAGVDPSSYALTQANNLAPAVAARTDQTFANLIKQANETASGNRSAYDPGTSAGQWGTIGGGTMNWNLDATKQYLDANNINNAEQYQQLYDRIASGGPDIAGVGNGRGATLNALRDLYNSGYFNTVNITNDPSFGSGAGLK